MSTGSSELASEDGIMLLADSIILASPLIGLAQLKNNLKKHKNQVFSVGGCSITPENVVYAGVNGRMGCIGNRFGRHAFM